MLDKLSSVLKKTTDKIANAIFLDKTLVDQIIKDLQRALIEADVNVSLVLQITQKIKQVALDERIKGLEKKEHVIKLLHDELLSILGEKREIKLQKSNTFMLVGLYGSGKTTTISKLASYYAKRGHKVCAIGLDVHRPAATDQLEQLGKKLNIPIFVNKKEKSPEKIYKSFLQELKKYDLVLVDTAGRDALDSQLIDEIKSLNKLISPSETILVMPADIGQAAKSQAQKFKEILNITGVIITRMDSTAKAGGSLTACAEVKAPVIFIGTGEKPSDLETFDPESFLSRLLGMGDLKTLMEKIHSVMDQKQIEEQQARLQEGKFTLKDLQTQLESMESLGSMDKVLSLIPGLGKAKEKISSEQLELQQEKVKHWKHAINSMTKEEVENPEILEKQTSRIARIAKGSGTSTSEIRALIKQYKMLKEMISSQSNLASGTMDQKTIMKFAKKFGRKMKF
ncbi:MAG: signal recognition particle receptor subunit alpha [Nanoarchaeota archaeon]|nr:signal recognition particle receptor subunit alpha [Nanoarchaeota archaeon]